MENLNRHAFCGLPTIMHEWNNMDKRQTLRANETFLALLQAAKKTGEKVHLLVDDKGIERREGWIKELLTDSEPPVLLLQDGFSVTLQQIVAVNGVFRPEYGEC